MSLTFGLDYDDTYTADPSFWDDFIKNSRERGHDVVIVTYRDDRHDWTEQMDYLVEDMKVQIYCTCGVAKAWWMAHFGVPVQIWIDDKPERINENSKATPEWLAEWREENAKEYAKQ